MSRKDISDVQVCRAYETSLAIRKNWDKKSPAPAGFYVDDLLVDTTGQPYKVCYRAMERACSRGYIEYGTWLRGGWLTDKGAALLKEITQ